MARDWMRAARMKSRVFHQGEKVKTTIVLACTLFACSQIMFAESASQDSPSHRQFIDTFQKHWSTAKDLATAVADAMPTESYDFKPTPPQMSFGELMVHIAQANYGYCAFIADAKSPYPEPAKDVKIQKAAAIKDLGGSFDYCTKVFDGLAEANLSQIHSSGKRSFSTLDTMLGVMVHMSHHRGQAEVYLRVKGITPPEYKW
jgi:uncharacterized damage-inducible protein DinB